MCLRGIVWLSQKVPEFGSLSKEEKGAIQDFSLLVSFFEGTKLNCEGSIRSIRNYVDSIESGSLSRLNIANYLQYVRDRYFVNGAFTGFYDGLHLKKNTQAKKYVDKMLQGNEISKADELIGCLEIVYRLRNNLFHGEKWRYQMQGQYDNFTMANNFLMSLFPSDINGT